MVTTSRGTGWAIISLKRGEVEQVMTLRGNLMISPRSTSSTASVWTKPGSDSMEVSIRGLRRGGRVL